MEDEDKDQKQYNLECSPVQSKNTIVPLSRTTWKVTLSLYGGQAINIEHRRCGFLLSHLALLILSQITDSITPFGPDDPHTAFPNDYNNKTTADIYIIFTL